MARKTTTSTEVKKRWNAKTYKRYQVNLRKVEDAELIKAVEAMREHIGLSDIFRLGIKTAIKENLSGAFEDTAEEETFKETEETAAEEE